MTYRLFTTVAAASVFVATGALAQDKSVTIASWGGSYQEAQSKALFEPAAADTGIEVKQETYGGMSDVRLQIAGVEGWINLPPRRQIQLQHNENNDFDDCEWAQPTSL